MLSESHIINYLKHAFPEHIGDDAACLPFSNTQSYVIGNDVLVENKHFRLRYQSPESLAHKALHVNLSDITAMGATPQFVLLSLSIPEHVEPCLDAFLHAFTDACKAASVLLIGGDTTSSPHDFFISITAMGIASTAELKLRSTINPGDLIYTTGNLGNAHLGFTALEEDKPDFLDFKHAFLNPTARLQEGAWLGKHTNVTGMMDISDGLWVDLGRMCRASHCGATLSLDACKPSKRFTQATKYLNLDPINTQLTGGEDYGLLLGVEPGTHQALTHDFKQTFGYELMHIGEFTQNNTISLMEHGQLSVRKLSPFSHF